MEIKEFFRQNKQKIDGESFNKRLFTLLDYYPAPKTNTSKIKTVQKRIILLFSFVGLALFLIFGGYDFIFSYAIPFAGVPSLKGTFTVAPVNIIATLTFLSILTGGIIAALKGTD